MNRTRSVRLWAGYVGSALVALWVVYACVDEARPLAPRPSFVATNADELGPPDPPWNVTSTPQRRTSIEIPTGRVARVTVSGTLSFEENPGFVTCSGHGVQSIPGGNTIGPGGVPTPPFPFRVFVGQSDDTHPAVAQIIQYGTGMGPGVGYTQGFSGLGVLWAGRPAAFGFLCGGGPQNLPPSPEFFVRGSQTITAELLADPTITADKSSITAGDMVTFTIQEGEGEPIELTEDLVWRWVPDPANPSRTEMVSGCGFEGTCRMRVMERGYARADGVHLHGFNVSAVGPTIAVGARALRLTLSVDNQLIRPRIPDVFFSRPCGQRFPEISADVTGFTVEARYSDGEAASGIDVTLETEFIAGSGGHDHQTESRPGFGGFRLGAAGATQAPLTVRTGSDGRVQGQFVAGTVGGFERVRAKAIDGDEERMDNQVVAIQVVGFQELGSSPEYVLIGKTDDHLSNHWALPIVLNFVQSVATNARRVVNDGNGTGSRVVQVNDMSIENGGVFDIHRNFQPDHFSHNRGVDIDVSNVLSTSGGDRVSPDTPGAVPLAYDDLVDIVWAARPSAFVLNESNRAHYHIRFVACPSN